MKKKRLLRDVEQESLAMVERWQEELARHVAYLPVLCEQAGVTEDELHQAIGIHFYVRSITRSGGIQ
jgi:hypothetical protein